MSRTAEAIKSTDGIDLDCIYILYYIIDDTPNLHYTQYNG